MLPRAHRGRRVIARALCAAVALSIAHGAAAQAAPDPVLPDLVADTPRWPWLEQYTDADGTRLLARFDGFVHNVGAGPAEFRGSARDGAEMTSVAQRIYRADGSWYETPRPGARIRFESEDGHSHWHLGEAARYSLWNYEDTAEVGPAQKVGFCFEDSERIEAHGPEEAVYADDSVRFCEQHNPDVAGVFMGISAGWRDIYDSNLAFQWVDVSDISPGRYWIHAEVDPLDLVQESNEQNEVAVSDAGVTVPGYTARAVVADGLESGSPSELTLRALIWGDPGAQQFRIESAPAHGTLSVPVGQWFSGPAVTYTPNANYEGTDSFSFSSRDATSPFPRNPVVATAALGVERVAETVAISGAPTQLFTGASAQLAAVVSHGPPAVTWTVNGVPGGDATVGTITPAGLYAAPATPPPGGSVTVGATSSTGAVAQVTVALVAAPPATPAPGTPGTGAPQPVLPPLLAIPKISVRGRTITASTVAGRAGVVETAAMIGKRRVALCKVKAPAKRRVTCKLTIARRYRLPSVKLVLRLMSGRNALASRSARLPRR